MNKPVIYSIIITHNRLEMLKQCLFSLFKQTYPIKKIIVVDNKSTDGTQKYLLNLKRKHQNLYPILNDVNLGMAHGINTALKKFWDEDWDAVWISDDDNIADKDALKNLVKFYDEKTILNSTLFDIKNKNDLTFPLADIQSGKVYFNKDQISKIKEGYIHSSSAFNFYLIPKYVFQKYKLLDENYFIRGDEIDFITKALLNNINLKTIINSQVFCLNQRNLKMFKFFTLKINREILDYKKNYYVIRNTLNLIKKHRNQILKNKNKEYFFNFYFYYKYPLSFFLFFYFFYNLFLIFFIYQKDKLKILYSVILAYYHFFIGKRGKINL